MLRSLCKSVCSRHCIKDKSVWLQQVRHFKQKKDPSGRRVPSMKGSSSKNTIKPTENQPIKMEQQTDKQSLEHLMLEPEVQGRIPFSRLIKPFGFACVFTACSFGGAAVWQYETMRSKALQRFADSLGGYFHSPKRGELRELVSFGGAAVWQYETKSSKALVTEVCRLISLLHQWYNMLNGAEKVTLGIIALNVLVFGFWKIPTLQPIMLRYFTASPASKAICLPMLLSTFSHYAIWHLGLNMYVLWSFSGTLGHKLGKEQFLAMYLSAGVWSSFASYLFKVASAKYIVSVGASGAIMAVLGACCLSYPDSKLAIVFLPFLTFSAGTGLKAIVAMETAGIALGWKFFDHAAHLGGLLSGMFYVAHGHKYLWDKREPYLKSWHEFRGKPKDV